MALAGRPDALAAIVLAGEWTAHSALEGAVRLRVCRRGEGGGEVRKGISELGN
jgi:hypothetical protein